MVIHDAGGERVGVSQQIPAGTLTVTRPVEPNGPLRPALIRYGGFASLFSALLAIGVGLLVARVLTARVAMVNQVLANTAAGMMGQRISPDGGLAEFGALAHHLNAMLDTLERRLSEMRLSSDRMAHDLRTPLTRIAGTLSAIEASEDEIARANAARARDEIDRVVHALNALLDLREIETESGLQLELFRLDDAVREAIDLYEAEAEDVHGVTFLPDLAPVEMRGSAPLMVRAVANLIENALRAAPPGSAIIVRVEAADGRAVVEVEDAGCGPPPSLEAEMRSQARLRSRWGGNGLGLTIVRAIARRHDGKASLERRGGTTVASIEVAVR